MGKASDKPSNLGSVAVRGASWTYIAFYSGKITVFLSTIILARLLTKGDFGVVGYAITVIGFLDVIKDLGIGLAVIYHDDEEVADTAFWLNLIIGLLLFLLVWITAPYVGVFFEDQRAVSITRILALNFPLSSIGSTHDALLVKRLAFNRKFIPDFSRAITKGFLSIILAYLNFGPWSLIYGQLSGTIVSVFILWRLVDWRPSFAFTNSIAQSLLKFGLPIVGVNIVSVLAQNMDYLVIGRYLDAEALGVYTLAFRIPELTLLQFCVIIAQVVFPVFTKIRDDVGALQNGFLETTRYVTLFTVPVGVGMALLSTPFVLTFFGEKWVDAAPIMSAISLYGLFISFGYNAGDVYKAQGRPGMLTVISFVHILILTPLLIWAVRDKADIVLVGWVQAFVALIISIIYLAIALRMLNLPLSRLLNAFKTSFIPALSLIGSVSVVKILVINSASYIQLILGVIVGAVSYIGFLYLFERKIVEDALTLIQKVAKR